jgi:GTP-binding nuclear protein Ran
MQTYNFLIVGDECTGKTSFIRRMSDGTFIKTYQPTRSWDFTPLTFNTNNGLITMNFFEQNECLLNYQMPIIHGVIILFDLTDKYSYRSVPTWYQRCKVYTNNIVLCGNKCDIPDRKVKSRNIHFHRRYNINYFDVSARSNYNFEKPYLILLKNLLGENTAFEEKIVEIEIALCAERPKGVPEVNTENFFLEHASQFKLHFLKNLR